MVTPTIIKNGGSYFRLRYKNLCLLSNTMDMEGVMNMSKVFMVYYENDCEIYGKEFIIKHSEHIYDVLREELPKSARVCEVEER